jgi:hypothetical protein
MCNSVVLSTTDRRQAIDRSIQPPHGNPSSTTRQRPSVPSPCAPPAGAVMTDLPSHVKSSGLLSAASRCGFFFFSVTLAAPNLAKLSKISHVRLRASPQEAMSSNLELSQALHLPRPCSARAKLAHDDSALAPEVPGHRCSPPASNLPLFQSSLEWCILPKLLAHLKRG